MPLLPYMSCISRKQAEVGFMKFSRFLISRTGTWAHIPRLAESNYQFSGQVHGPMFPDLLNLIINLADRYMGPCSQTC